MSSRHQPKNSDGSTSLGRLLRVRREQAGLTLAEVARQTSVSRPYLSRLERGAYEHPSPRVLIQISKLLKISKEDLYAATGYRPPESLPNFGPYVRATHGHWPESALQELEQFYDYLKYKYSID